MAAGYARISVDGYPYNIFVEDNSCTGIAAGLREVLTTNSHIERPVTCSVDPVVTGATIKAVRWDNGAATTYTVSAVTATAGTTGVTALGVSSSGSSSAPYKATADDYAAVTAIWVLTLTAAAIIWGVKRVYNLLSARQE